MNRVSGLLGGLEEFPTEAGDHAAESIDSSDRSRSALQSLLQNDVVSLPSKNSAAGSDTGVLRITKDDGVGDVLHIFSHIRKTYRVRWVVLEGGDDEPPSLRPQTHPSAGAKSTKKTKGALKATATRSTKKRRRGIASEPVEVINIDEEEATSSKPLPTNIRWVPLSQVADAKYVYSSLV
jgi:A/G-specific adenine glycosylase